MLRDIQYYNKHKYDVFSMHVKRGGGAMQSEGVQTVERALAILNCFTNEDDIWGVTELSKKLELSKSVIHRILVTLHRNGFVDKDVYTDKYRLGMKVIELGKVATNQLGLRKIALPIMQEMGKLTGESVLLTKKQGKMGLGIEIVEGPYSIAIRAAFGIGLPLHCGASKKVLLAFQTQEFIDTYLQNENLIRVSDKGTIDANVLKEELTRIRQEGVAVTAGDVDFGAYGVAAPIYDDNGNVFASISVSGRSFGFLEERAEQISLLVKKAAREISVKLGYPHHGVKGEEFD